MVVVRIRVEQSELIAISGALDHALNSYKDSIWILTDSRSYIQYLKNWPKIMGSTSLDILSKLVRLDQRKQVRLQWIPSHVGVPGNEAADELVGLHQTALARLRSGHLRGLIFVQEKSLSLPVPALSLLLLLIFWTAGVFPSDSCMKSKTWCAVSTGFLPTSATWSVTDWRRVIFSDESRFSLSADDHRTRVWRRTGQRSDPAFIVERHTAISQGVTVWGAISWDTRSSLVVLQGTLTARRYVDDILTPIVLPMLSSRPGTIYQQDNARPHTARLSQQCLQGYDVLPWPARSPDLSPIEHVWTRWEGNCSRPEIQEN
ncbi:transposable element Tc1 transposase [Trichonephila clavipes]|nr:transposable element Tc1 transposase [Trichonephila clavipes]